MEAYCDFSMEDVIEVCGGEMVMDTEMIMFDETPRGQGRFARTSKEELETDIENSIPKKTREKTKWAMKIYRTWLAEWRVRIDDNILKVLKPIEEFSYGDLDYTLEYFFCDVRKVDGTRYPPQTLKEIACAIQFHFNNTLKWNISIFKDKEFKRSRESLDSQMKKGASLGLVKPKKRADVITFEDESKLWKEHKFGRSNPEQLIHTLLYHLGLHLSLRACKEHRDLTFGEDSQLELINDKSGEYLVYTERISKNKQFGLKHARMEPKQTRIYSLTDNPDKCVVSMYKEYVNHRP